ncbi:olfactory receptor 6B1-like [Bufo gargarizans]|uniref:olfactory receptor 6B1-like n=1 Tax=Bufo gargarizans TaxID=30331 RepID=UPI001CF3D139|nr:olfactory receptor 6B1-like [Bufo gargarizans]
MEYKNKTEVTEFLLCGFPSLLELQIILFIFFLLIYVLTVSENIIIVATVQLHPKLQKPMYFFLSNLAFLEICYVSVTIPNLLVIVLAERKTISFSGCMTQLFFFISLMCSECVLLAVMAFDRYVAVCLPLHYVKIMRHELCIQLAVSSWVSGFAITIIKMYFISKLSFCGPNIINHFFCDISPVLNLACIDMSLAELVDFILALVILLIPLLVTTISYICIIYTILKISSTDGRQKAFSTCASHLTVVTMFFSTTLFMYARPKKAKSVDANKLISLLYAVFTPMINPFIYCLRNKEIWDILIKYLCHKKKFPDLFSVYNNT